MSPDNYTLVFSKKSQEQDYVRVFLRSSGADSDRRVWVKQYPDGFWYIINNADTYVKVREPVASSQDNQHDADMDATLPTTLQILQKNMFPKQKLPLRQKYLCPITLMSPIKRNILQYLSGNTVFLLQRCRRGASTAAHPRVCRMQAPYTGRITPCGVQHMVTLHKGDIP